MKGFPLSILRVAPFPLARLLTASTVILAAGLADTGSVRAAAPYDKSLEARVEALEKELNIMEDDSKGKNVAATPRRGAHLSARGRQRGAGTDDLGRPALPL